MTERHGLGLVGSPAPVEKVETAPQAVETPETSQTTPCSPLSTSSKSKEAQGEVAQAVQKMEATERQTDSQKKDNYKTMAAKLYKTLLHHRLHASNILWREHHRPELCHPLGRYDSKRTVGRGHDYHQVHS